MKNAILFMITKVFVITLPASCNKNVCPVYVMAGNAELTQINNLVLSFNILFH